MENDIIKMDTIESIVAKINHILLPEGDCDDVELELSDSDSEGDEEVIEELCDSLVQLEYDELMKKQKEKYNERVDKIQEEKIRYTFAPIPEKKKSDCIEKRDMKDLVKKLRANYKNNKFVDKKKSTL